MIEEIQETGILICFISFKRQEVKSLIRGSLWTINSTGVDVEGELGEGTK